MKLLTREEAKALLTKSDLKKLERQVTENVLRAMVDHDVTDPYIIVRSQMIPFFIVLELIGTL